MTPSAQLPPLRALHAPVTAIKPVLPALHTQTLPQLPSLRTGLPTPFNLDPMSQRLPSIVQGTSSQEARPSRGTFVHPGAHHFRSFSSRAELMDRHVQGVAPLSPVGSSSEDGEAGQLVHPNREAGDPEDLKLTKKARRKEQCRVNQANYRKRKRAYEQQLAGYIKNLEDEINDLTARREALSQFPLSEQSNQDEKSSPEEEIASFYQYLQDHRPTKAFSNGARIELSSALDLQWEEFASIEQLRHQWSLYVHQFDTFQVEMTSSDHFQAGDHVIVRITGSLFIRIANQEPLNPTDSEKWFFSVIRCPVQHRFEFDVYENKFTRITSEVDWVSGIATSTNTRPETVLEMLHELLQTSC